MTALTGSDRLPPEPDDDAALVEALAREFRRQAAITARRLRDAADDTERHAATVHADLRDLRLDFSGAARDITHDVQSMMGNLNLDAVVRSAADADRAARAGGAS